MLINSTQEIPVSDTHTCDLCLELINFLSAEKEPEIAALNNACSKLDTYMKEAISKEPSFYSAKELEFLIDFLKNLSEKIEADKQQVAAKIIKKQRNKKAVSKYKANS